MDQDFGFGSSGPVEAFGEGAGAMQAWLQRNPQLSGGMEEPAPCETATVHHKSCGRTVPAGGCLSGSLLPEVFTPLEHVFRKLPQEGIYEATRQRPYQFEMGAFTVPRSMGFIFSEYNFQIFRQNGAVAGDAVPVEDRRLSLQVGYDVNIDRSRRGNIEVQIVPILPSEIDKMAAAGVVTPPTVDFQAPQVTFPQQVVAGVVLPNVYGAPGAPGTGVSPQTGWEVQDAQSHIDASAAGSALLPQESKVQGPSQCPFTYILNANQSVQLRITVFAPVRIPVAFFESRILGYVVPKNAMASFLKGIDPCW